MSGESSMLSPSGNINNGTTPPTTAAPINSVSSPGVDAIANNIASQSQAGGMVAQMNNNNMVPGTLNYQMGLALMRQQQQQHQQQQQQQQQQQHQYLASNNQNYGGGMNNINQSLTGSGVGGLSSMHRSPSMPRLGQAQFSQYVGGAASGNSRSPLFYGGGGNTQMAINHLQQQQQQQLVRATVLAQGGGGGGGGGAGGGAQGMSMFSPQSSHLSNISPQYYSHQMRQKQSQLQNSQFQQSASAGQQLQNFQSLAMMGPMGPGSQNRISAFAYAQQAQSQSRVNAAALRSPNSTQPASPQGSLSSPQKLQSQNLQRGSSFSTMNTQISGLSQGQSIMSSNSLQQPNQWSKMQQSNLPSMSSPMYQLQQQQRQQQLQAYQTPLSPSPSQQSTSHSHQLSPQQGSQQEIQTSLQGQLTAQINSVAPTLATPSLSGQTISITSHAAVESNTSQGTQTSTHILGKRSIQDLVSQVDSQAALDPDVEDLLLELADNYIQSVTMFASAIAKHRKSTTLEPDDVLLHLEKNWKLSIPGFSYKESVKRKKLCPQTVNEASTHQISAIQSSFSAPQMENLMTSPVLTEVANTNNEMILPPGNSNTGFLMSKGMHDSSSMLISSSSDLQAIPRF